MPLGCVSTMSRMFSGPEARVLHQISDFLAEVRASHPGAGHFGLVHGLCFPHGMGEVSVVELNGRLSEVYREHSFVVLGGDTSSGSELCFFISAVAS